MKQRQIRKLTALLLALALLTGCGAAPGAAGDGDPESALRSTRYLDSMDTVIELTACGKGREAALDAAAAEIGRLNALLSIGLEESEVSRLNREGSGTLGADAAYLLRRALEIHAATGGAFDPTVYPLMALWGFPDGNCRVPSQDEIRETLARVGAERIVFDAQTGAVTLDEGQALDLGGIAKGYASQRIMEIFRENGVRSGIVNLGGNVQCLGAKPDGTAWRVGVRNPDTEAGGLVAVVAVKDRAVISSGGYERFFVDEESGLTYEHIMDPGTGMPVRGELAQVTVVTADGTLGDALSTALYIMGLEAAAEYWRAHSGQFDAVFVLRDGSVWITAGLEGSASAVKGGPALQVLR